MGKILFADDDAAMRLMVTDMLTAAGHSVRTVDDGTAALKEIRLELPDLVLLDYRMGNVDGLEVCRKIKEDARTQHLPVLILTAESHVEDRIRGFAAGANDYLPKPFDHRELLARVQALLRLSEQGRELNPTTGLPGGIAIDREFERRRRRNESFTLCYLDLDFFKAFNDRFGFPVANGVIEALGNILQEAVAGTDSFAAHIGGDDFILMCDRASARHLVERTQKRFREVLGRLIPAETLSRGSYVGRQRSGEEVEVPLTRIAAAMLHLEGKKMPPLAELGEVAADAKNKAKQSIATGIVELEIGADGTATIV